jgi:hypothetical protein
MSMRDSDRWNDVADWDDAWEAADPKNVDLLDKASASDTASTQSLYDAGRKIG